MINKSTLIILFFTLNLTFSLKSIEFCSLKLYDQKCFGLYKYKCEKYLCSKNETIRSRFNELKAFSQSSGKSFDFLTLSDDVFDYELRENPTPTSPQQNEGNDKNIIIVNEWNEKGFIGDYGAYAYSETTSLTTNQQMISKR